MITKAHIILIERDEILDRLGLAAQLQYQVLRRVFLPAFENDGFQDQHRLLGLRADSPQLRVRETP